METLDGEITPQVFPSMYMTIVGDGEAITAGTILTLLGDGTILTTIRGDGDGTILGDTTVGAGPDITVGDTHIIVGAGPDIMAGAVTTTTGIVHIITEVMHTCQGEEVTLRVSQEQLYLPEQMDIPAEYEIIADVPMPPCLVATII